MKIDVGFGKIETDDINIVSVDGKYGSSNNVFADGCVAIYKKNGTKTSYFVGRGFSVGKLQDAVRMMGSLFKDSGVQGFVVIRDRFLININNMNSIYLEPTGDGLFLVEAIFKNGQVVEIYRGQRGKFAANLVKDYQRAERDYFNSIEQVK